MIDTKKMCNTERVKFLLGIDNFKKYYDIYITTHEDGKLISLNGLTYEFFNQFHIPFEWFEEFKEEFKKDCDGFVI